MNKFNELIQISPEVHRPHINSFATDRDGTVRAFYTREPRPIYQRWDSDSTNLIVKQVAPMDDDWNHSLVQRPKYGARSLWNMFIKKWENYERKSNL